MTRIAVITANCGGFERLEPPVAQELPSGCERVEHLVFDDANFPRRRTLDARLQARIPKMFGWDMVPDFDLYIWHDGSYAMQHPGAAAWFASMLWQKEACFFLHPHRDSVIDEAAYIAGRIAAGDKYLCSRYQGEDVEGQLRAIDEDFWWHDFLIASSAFAYKPTQCVKELLAEWWIHTSRFHAVDQLALPYLIWKHQPAWTALTENVYDFPYLTRTRERNRG